MVGRLLPYAVVEMAVQAFLILGISIYFDLF
jgi:hypothetical protein